MTRGVGYLANAAKQAVVGDGLARENHNPAGEVTATRCAARSHRRRRVSSSGNRTMRDQHLWCLWTCAGNPHTCVAVPHVTQACMLVCHMSLC